MLRLRSWFVLVWLGALFCVNWTAAAAQDNKPGAFQPRQAEANGVVHSAIPGKVNLSHEAIPLLGWPPMQMDFNLSSKIDVTTLRPGLRVRFVVRETAPSQYQIVSIAPVD